jgi:hypothetical protein
VDSRLREETCHERFESGERSVRPALVLPPYIRSMAVAISQGRKLAR